MSKRAFKSQASSSRVAPTAGFGGFGSTSSGTALSYLAELPNFSSLSDANVVVAFKNLTKKDATTKAKALEDLRSYIQANPYEPHGGPEEAVLEAWVKLYPRLSIDNSRRVRELSHITQYELLKTTRKRMEKYIPSIVGTWLAGTFDRDRGVARSANDGISSFLDTEAKVTSFWKRCQLQILEYAQDTFNETPQTLSDERTVSADEIQEKYFRVVGSSVSLVVNLLIKLNAEDISKFQDKYEDFLSSNKQLWHLASCEDAFTRRSVDQLLMVCLGKQSEVVAANLRLLSQSFISEALGTPQSSSAYQLLQALHTLTRKFPEAWTSAYKSSKSPFSKLRRFVERGSQGGPPEYWSLLRSLISIIPESALQLDLKTALSFLEVFRVGISSREEAKGNISSAWISYFEVCKFFGAQFSDPQSVGSLLSESVYPAFEHYLGSASPTSKWPLSSEIVAKAYEVSVAPENSPVQSQLKEKWKLLSEEIIARLQTSLPEQSKDFQKSQNTVLSQGQRWFELVSRLENSSTPSISAPLLLPSSNIILAALKVMESRNGKPFSAAGTIYSAVRQVPILVQETKALEKIKGNFESNAATFILSPSATYLFSTLLHIGFLPGQEQFLIKVWQETLQALLDSPDSDDTLQGVTIWIGDDRIVDLAHKNEGLQNFLISSSSRALQGESRFWALLDRAIKFSILTDATTHQILEQALGKLEMNDSDLDGAFTMLESLSKKGNLLKDPNMHVAIVTKLLALTELSDSTIAPRAVALRAVIERADARSDNIQLKESPIAHLIRENLETASSRSLSVSTLVQQARSVIESSSDESVLSSLFFDTTQWSKELQPYLDSKPNPSLAILSSYASAALVETATKVQHLPQVSRDLSGYTIPLRIAFYTASLLPEKAFKSLTRERQVETLRLLCLSLKIVGQQLDVLEESGLFELQVDNGSEEEIRDNLWKAQSEVNSIATNARSWRRNREDAILDSSDFSSLWHELMFSLIDDSAGFTAKSYYSAGVLHSILPILINAHGWRTEGGDEWLTKLDVLKSSTTNYLAAIGVLGIGEVLETSKLVNNLCNRLISDVAGASAQSKKTLPLMVLLNATLEIYSESDLPVAQNRLVFAVKQMLGWTGDLIVTNPELVCEVCRTLQTLLPAIKGVYGSYWEDSIKFCISIWNSCDGTLADVKIPMVGMALKLYSVMVNLRDANDDLVDSLAEHKDQIADSLITILCLRRRVENNTVIHLDNQLSWLIRSLPTKIIQDPSELYPLLATDFKAVQSAAYDLLSRTLPEKQQEISVNVLLENKDACLPEELLSLLLDAPLMQNYSDDELGEFPAHLRGYLFSWRLVFASYPNASYKVRNDYTEALKSENYIYPLLDFLFDALGHSAGKPINLDKARFSDDEIKDYNIWSASNEPSKRDLEWLLLNLYYLTLKYTPNLAKSWWLDCKSKQTRNSVEAWTQKYFGRLVVQNVLDEVSTWADEQDALAEDEKELTVKVVRKAGEIYAGYEVDDMMAQIVIRVPPNYPFEGVRVEGVNRIAASEKKWASWLMITQGAITFSNGSITDGLLTFRKNIIGALKGQTECAICYSIISADKKMPDKRCQTCKNLFHSGCLFKWFASSNQNTCPLCRNPFNYGAAAKRGGGRHD